MKTYILAVLYLLFCTALINCSPDCGSNSENIHPVITSLTAIPDKIKESDTTIVKCIASDEDGDKLTYDWNASSGTINGTGDSILWIAPNETGIFAVYCLVRDGNGGEASDSVLIEVIQNIPLEGLIAAWLFNGNANDESGNEIHCTVNGARLTTDRFGNLNSAYSFDGQDDYLEANASNLPTTERTISLWFYANSVDNRPGLLGYGGGGGRGTSWFMGLNVNGLKSFHMSCHYLVNRIDYYYSDPPVDSWFHWVVMTSDEGTKLYVNGVLEEANPNFVNNTFVAAKELGIGVISNTTGSVPYTDGNVKYFNGSLDDIRIYNRALTESEVQLLYHESGRGN